MEARSQGVGGSLRWRKEVWGSVWILKYEQLFFAEVSRAKPAGRYIMGRITGQAKECFITSLTEKGHPNYARAIDWMVNQIRSKKLTKVEAVSLRDRLLSDHAQGVQSDF